ncbi:hypothetical protein LLG96_03245 [bacterium]|nr:hypothetical protein [bacterium]
MKSSSISVSNAMVLSLREWIITIFAVAVICSVIYYGWNSWESFTPGPDHRETCWAERQSDYWAYNRWIRYAREHYKVLLLGDSVIWGQEVPNTGTISHYINEYYGKELVANLGNDGLFMAGINGIAHYWGDNLSNTNILLQLSPLWVLNLRRDLREDKKYNYHHPRLIPQFSRRIKYHHDLNTRLGYFIERYLRLFPFVRHLMANYYDNKSISGWMMDNPYSNPFKAITFVATPVMAESQGQGISWELKKVKPSDEPFVPLSESIQWGLFTDAIQKFREKNTRVFVLIGPFNQYMLTPESQQRLFATVEDAKKDLDAMGVPYFDSFKIGIPSNEYGDSCHLLNEGHMRLAHALLDDESFKQWLAEIK